MNDRLRRAREAVRRASDRVDDDTAREQLRSIDEGLEAEAEAAAEDDPPVGDELQVVERKLAGLVDDAEGPGREGIRAARDAIDDYRQAETRDW